MRRRRLIWHLYPSYLLVTIAALLAIGGFASFSIQRFYQRHLEDDLLARARLLSPLVVEVLLEDPEQAQQHVHSWADMTDAHVTVVYPDGRVIADSEQPPRDVANLIDRLEIRAAKKTGEGKARGYNPAIRERMMYTAVPSFAGDNMVAILRLGIPLTFLQSSLWAFNGRLLFAGVVIAVLAAVVSWFMSQRIAKPLYAMRRGAERFAKGDFAERLAVPDFQEFASLAEAMNHMAGQLDERIRTVVSQRNLQEAILASMVEGVIAVDTDDTIVTMNKAAGRLLEVDAEEAVGQNLSGVIRNAAFQRFVSHVRQAGALVDEEIVLHERGDQVVHMHGAVLRDDRALNIGVAIVLHDVTRLRRLEQVRRDFVANVSHELKTPITSIKGFIETIQNHTLNNPQEMGRFLRIVAKQSDRLAAILEDLLTLSRMDQNEGRYEITFQEMRLKPVMQSAVQVCSTKAAEKDLEIVIQGPEDVTARVNEALFEQALTNLLDNAVKYSERGSRIVVSLERIDREVAVRVSDQGCGIAAEHIPRLFERFYRVDKARSRAMGGTGLGLAIVKHIVNAHHGRIEVESTPGKGSTFSIILPGL
ncbi:MAG: ATP-binding protein [Candidatus Hydrogenedentota bacterium]